MPDDVRNLPAAAPQNPLRQALDKMTPEFAMALPSHIPPERFKRVALTAINQSPELAAAEKRSVIAACMKAAQDGLLPDGREGAIVVFGGKAQWMPMVYGILKKARNSGDIASITARCVYEKDAFRYVMGDEEKLEHVPTLDGDPGPLRLVYAIAKLKDGEIVREVMTRTQVERARNVSRSKNGPAWRDWYDEMARKTAIKRLVKYLPQSSELDATLRRDDTLAAREIEGTATPAPAGAIAAPQSGGGDDAFERAAAGEVIDAEPAAEPARASDDAEFGMSEQRREEPPPPEEEHAADERPSSWEIAPQKRGKAFDWPKWRAAIEDALSRCRTADDVDQLAADNAEHFAAFAEAYRASCTQLRDAVNRRREELLG